jgi:serine/threonine protein kinase
MSKAGSPNQAHSKSAAEPEIRTAFANDDQAIRIEPYLHATGMAHPPLAARLDSLAQTTLSTKRALVHGDVSPKNILDGPDGPVFLDAECAEAGLFAMDYLPPERFPLWKTDQREVAPDRGGEVLVDPPLQKLRLRRGRAGRREEATARPRA